MLKSIKNKKITIILKDEKIVLPENIKEKINLEWKKALEKTPELWNGEVVCVSSYKNLEDKIIIECKKTTYSHYLYDERFKLPKEYSCYNLSAGYLVETKDGYYVIGKLANNTSYPGCLQISAGAIDSKEDISGEHINYTHTMNRELKEELNIDIHDDKLVSSVNIPYFWEPEDEANAHSIFGKIKLNFTADEMEKYYKDYLNYLKENNLEIEFEKLYFLKKETALEELEKLENPKREYLKTLLKADFENSKEGN